jgi:L-lysine 2,3-aminomutase
MRRGDPHDPLLRQVLAVGAELLPATGYSSDPLQEADVREAPGLLHKYHGRALLITTGACAVHCRYCFRRHYDYGQEQSEAGTARWSAALEHLATDATIGEIILSGGDPLSLGNPRLTALLRELQSLRNCSASAFTRARPLCCRHELTADCWKPWLSSATSW